MDPLLLRYYERELQFVKEMGAEYAAEFPKIAGRLGIDGIETSDPYVERLYEGFAFLAARVQLRIDADYPRFSQNLLNIVYPQYLAPTPSMAVVQFRPSAIGGFESGAKLERHTMLKANSAASDQTSCTYRTAHDVTMWPIKLSEVEYFSNMASVADLELPPHVKAKAGLRIRISSLGEQPLNEILMDSLTLYLSGHLARAQRVYEQLFGASCGFLLRSVKEPAPWSVALPSDSLRQVGFADQESLLPTDGRTFSGYRLLREYFAFPERYLFAEFANLGAGLERCQGTEVELIILLDRVDPELEGRLTAEDFSLFCTPAINLFPKRVDRIHVSQSDREYHVVPDRTRPADFEVFELNSVAGFGTSAEDQQAFLPFYACNDLTNYPDQAAYFSLRREGRVLSTRQRRSGPRSSYIGSECFISLVDAKEAPFSSELKQLELQTLCTNRDLPLRMPVAKGATDFDPDMSAPVDAIKCIKGPTPPKPSLAYGRGETGWRLINQLSLNYLSLVDDEQKGGASALRELLILYADDNDAAIKKQIEGVRSVRAEQVTRRIPVPGPIAFGKGLQITVVCEEAAFAGTGIFLLGSVLEQFFARYVSINSFTETVIRSDERGEIMKWPVRIGQRSIA